MKYFITIAVVFALLAFVQAQSLSDQEDLQSDTETPPHDQPRPPKHEAHERPPRPGRSGRHPLGRRHPRPPHSHEGADADGISPEARAPGGQPPRKPVIGRRFIS